MNLATRVLQNLALTTIVILFGTSTALAQNATNGKALWESTCGVGGGCHSATTPDNAQPRVKPVGETAAGIRNTINSNKGGMGALRSLTDAQLTDIAAYIASATVAIKPAQNYSGWWFKSDESGWGINVEQNLANDKVFAALFTYGAPPAGSTISPGIFFTIIIEEKGWTTPTSFSANVFSTKGPNFKLPTFDRNQVVVAAEGTATVTFTSSNAGNIVIRFNDGTVVTKPIVRFTF